MFGDQESRRSDFEALMGVPSNLLLGPSYKGPGSNVGCILARLSKCVRLVLMGALF